MSLNIVALCVMISCLIIFMISIIVGITIYILRRQQWKKEYQTPIDCLNKSQPITIPKTSNYDNVTYEAFRNNVQLISSDDNDSITVKNSDDSSSYEPKIIYLGGEQQLTAIFA